MSASTESPRPLQARPWLACYAPGVPAEIGPVTQSLIDMLDTSVRRYSRSTALEFFGATLSYRQLGDQVARVAGGLKRLGVRRGDRVALILPNCPQHVVAFYAVLRLGAVVVEHNPLYTARELRHQFEDHGAGTVIAWDKVCDLVADLPDDLGIRNIIAVNITAAFPAHTRLALRLPLPKARTARAALTARPRTRRAQNFDNFLAARRLPSRHPRPTVNDLAALQYTSGTTGHPKGAMLSHGNLRANAMQGRAWVPGLREGKESFYGVLPLFHAYGLTLCLTFALSIGARLVLFPKFDVGLIARAAKRTPPTFLPAVPPIYDQLARAAGRQRINLSRLRFAISGAMSLPVATVQRWEAITGGLLVEGYGMTESAPISLGNPIGPSRRPGTVGIPFPSTAIRVVDPEDTTQDVVLGAPGELLVRGPQIFHGYWRRPAETAEVLLPDGWLRTGDIVTVSADGFVTVVDRIKELIITGGFNVSPSEVEQVLRSHPDVVDVAVVALPRPAGGEEVAAAVVLRSGVTLDTSGLRDHARLSLTPYKVPKHIFAVPELPRSLMGKVLRRAVREQLLDLSAR